MLKHTWIRTLRIDILTLFISLVTTAFILVIAYSYLQNYKAILDYSRGTMERNSTAIIGDINDLQHSAIETLDESEGIFIDNKNFSIHDHEVQLYMLQSLAINTDFSSFFFAFPNASRITAKRISASTQTHFVSNPEKILPSGTTYSIKVMDPNQKPPEMWYYTDNNFNIIAQESFPQLTYSLTERPWFQKSLITRHIFWTEPYYFANTQDLGLTATKPVYNFQNQLIAIIGVDISFLQLSNFIKNEKIGKHGETFITDQTGNIMVPQLDKGKISASIVQKATQYFNQKGIHNFSFIDNHHRYLSYVGVLPSIFGKHWLIITVLPFSNFFSGLMTTQINIILISLLVLLLSILVIFYFSKRISTPIIELSQEIDKVTNLDLSSQHVVESAIVEIRRIANSVAAMRSAMRSFSRYVPKDIVKQLLIQGKDITLQVEKRNLTIFFSDIQDFTSIVETHTLNTMMPLLNDYFDGLSKIILDNNGTIDKYIGDSIMAFWGAPLDDPNHVYSACKTALLCNAFSKNFNENCSRQGKPILETRFGISSGAVVVGNIGTKERMNYTVIGDIVNIAARLQATNKLYQTRIIIGDKTYHKINKEFLTRPLDTVAVKGKKRSIKIYELMALQGEDANIGTTESEKKLSQMFTQAYDLYIQGNFNQAKSIFENINSLFPNDYPTQLYLERLKESDHGTETH